MSTEEMVMPQEKSREDKVMDAWFHLLYTVIWPFFNLFRPIKAVGRENIPDGPVVICPNHSSMGDPFFVAFAFGRCPMRAMAKIEVMRIPFVGWILGKAGVFGVDRDKADMKAVKTALKALKDGNKLLLFPEGTRVKEGESVAIKTGAAMFATRTNTPLLPVYIPTKKKWFRPNRVVIGQPYYPKYEGRKPTPEELDAISEDLMRRVQKLGEGVK